MSRTSESKCVELCQRYENEENNGVYCERENVERERALMGECLVSQHALQDFPNALYLERHNFEIAP